MRHDSSYAQRAHQRGRQAEALVREHLEQKGCSVLYHQKKIFGVEYDWIFQYQTFLIYVEVKSVRNAQFFLQRWPYKQKQRFIRVARLLAEQKPSKFYLALVDEKNKIHLFQIGRDIEVD